MKRGVKIFITLLSTLLNLIFVKDFSFAQNSTVNISYTAPIGMQTLNPNISANKNYYNTNVNGAIHSILSEIFKNSNAKLTYTPFNNYNDSLQASMLHLSSQTFDLIIGITFDENNLNYLNYIPQPIYTDNIAIVINNSNIGDKGTLTKDLFETISNLSKKNEAVTIENLNLFLPNLSSHKIRDINTAMETILNTKTFLIIPMELIVGYLKENQTNPRVKNLKILKYPENVNYLIAINKNKTQEKIKENNQLYSLQEFIETKLNGMIESKLLQKIIDEFKTK
ncbi:hypothetical protein HDR60_01595 [bacterium]|nr:hypothetical protein [bacterium]